MSTRRQLVAQLLIVVDLAVEDDRERAVVHRLRTGGGEIDDRQAPMSESGAAIVLQPDAFGIGTARAHALARHDELGAINVPRILAVREDAVDSAHAFVQWRIGALACQGRRTTGDRRGAYPPLDGYNSRPCLARLPSFSRSSPSPRPRRCSDAVK